MQDVAITFTSMYDQNWDSHMNLVWSDLLGKGKKLSEPLNKMTAQQEHAPTFILKMLLNEFERLKKGSWEIRELRKR